MVLKIKDTYFSLKIRTIRKDSFEKCSLWTVRKKEEKVFLAGLEMIQGRGIQPVWQKQGTRWEVAYKIWKEILWGLKIEVKLFAMYSNTSLSVLDTECIRYMYHVSNHVLDTKCFLHQIFCVYILLISWKKL